MKKTLLLFVLFYLPYFLKAQLSFVPKASNLGASIDLINDPIDTSRFFVVLQTGKIKILNGAYMPLANDFIDISDVVNYGGERGLLSMAFHPDYAINGYIFVLYTALNGDLTLARYSRSAQNADTAQPASGVVLKSIPHPTYSNHNGGKINFGSDGYLYWSTGDGGGGGDPYNNAQDGLSLLGKMLRYDVDNFTTPPYYSIPTTNPFLQNPNVLDDIWALGLRNPFRWSFDRQTNDMWIADVGQNLWEEVNVAPSTSGGGENYGWKCKEGNHVFSATCNPSTSPITDPVFEYDHSLAAGGFSVTGGYVYRGSWSGLVGKYICSDFVSGNVWLLTKNGSSYTSQIFTTLANTDNIAGFGEKANGDLFAVSLNGDLYEIQYVVTSADQNLADKKNEVTLMPNIVTNNMIHLQTNTAVEHIVIHDVAGRNVYSSYKKLSSGTSAITIPDLFKGIYYLKIRTSTNAVVIRKFIVE